MLKRYHIYAFKERSCEDNEFLVNTLIAYLTTMKYDSVKEI